jgi:WD40 repeat protein
MLTLQGARERVERLYFSLQGNTLVAPLQGCVQLWQNAHHERQPAVLSGAVASSVQFIPNSTRMLFDGPQVSLRDGSGREEARFRFAPPVTDAAEVAVSPDGRMLVFAQSAYSRFDKGRLVCRTLDEPSIDLWSVPGVYRFPHRAMFLPGGDRFVAMEWWNGETGFEHGPAWITRETGTGRVIAESIEQGNGYRTLVQSPDLSLFVGLSENHMTVYRIADMSAPLATIKNDSKKHFTGAAFHPGGRILAATSNDNTVKFYDIAARTMVGGFNWEVGRLRSVTLNADGSLAAAGADKGQIVLWDVDL